MKKNYLTYPVKNMRITQTYAGGASHKPHTTGSPKDYPIDEGGKDTGREYMYCPCDEVIVKRIYGVGTSGTNTLWLQSTSKVYFADGTSDYCTIQITHPNDDDLLKMKVGQKFRRGEAICREGMDGATGNHLHISAGKGTIKGNGWTLSSTSKWVLTVNGSTDKPENLFYIDPDFTTVINNAGLKFKNLPTETTSAKTETAKYTTGNYKVDTAVLNVRKGPGTNYDKVKFSEMTASAKSQIKKLFGAEKDGYVKGVEFTVLEIKGVWGRTPSGWVCLDYCRKA